MTREEVHLFLYTRAGEAPQIARNDPRLQLPPGVRAVYADKDRTKGDAKVVQAEWEAAGKPRYPDLIKQLDEEEGPRLDAYCTARWATDLHASEMRRVQLIDDFEWPRRYADANVDRAFDMLEAAKQ
jgi:hypothetical protein